MRPPVDQSSAGEAILGTCLVEVGEVNADSLLTTLFHSDWVGEPIRVVCLLDEVCS